MMQFFRTTSVELSKIFKRKSTYVFAILLFVLALIVSGLNYYTLTVIMPNMKKMSVEFNEKMAQDDSLTEEERQEIEMAFNELSEKEGPKNQEILESLRLELSDLEKMKKQESPDYDETTYRNRKNQLTVLEYRLDNGLTKLDDKYNPRGFDYDGEFSNSWENLSTKPIYITIIFIILASILSMQVAGEFENGTIKGVLMKPGSRLSILAAKFSAVLLTGFILQVYNYFLHLLLDAVFFGFGNMNKTIVFAIAGKAYALPIIVYTILLYLLSTISLIMPLSMVLLFAVSTRSNAGSIAISLGIYMLVNSIIIALSQNFKWLRFTPFVHMNLENYLLSEISVPGTGLLYSAVMGIIYATIFMIASAFIFDKRDV